LRWYAELPQGHRGGSKEGRNSEQLLYRFVNPAFLELERTLSAAVDQALQSAPTSDSTVTVLPDLNHLIEKQR
jgi:hypothetical protein